MLTSHAEDLLTDLQSQWSGFCVHRAMLAFHEGSIKSKQLIASDASLRRLETKAYVYIRSTEGI